MAAVRAPRTRFTEQMDNVIRHRLQSASGKARRGEVRRAVAAAAGELGIPEGAVLKRWYRLRAVAADGRNGQAAVPAPASAGARATPVASLVIAYHRALAETAARRADLARAEAELSEAASRLALHLTEP